MFSKPRPSISLQMLTALQPRKQLSDEDTLLFSKYRRGYNGEKKLAALLEENLNIPHIALHDIQLHINGNEFQMDCLLIVANQIYILESKNYYGDFYIENSRWYHYLTNKEYKDPVQQLIRCERLLKEFLINEQIRLPVISTLIFMDSKFFLYNAVKSMPIIFPSQYERFLEQLNSHQPSLTKFHHTIAVKFKKVHITQSRHGYIPDYEYGEVRKGVFCGGCGSLMEKKSSKTFTCNNCNITEFTETVLKRSVDDFQLLFPKRQLKTEEIFNWMGKVVSINTVWRHLTKNFERKGKGRGTYYR